MAFWDFFEKDEEQEKQKLQKNAIEIFENRIVPAVQDNQVPEVQKSLEELIKLHLDAVSNSIYQKMIVLDTPTLLKFAKILATPVDSGEVHKQNISNYSHIASTFLTTFLRNIHIGSINDRLWIFFGELLLLDRSRKFLSSEFIHTIYDCIQHVLGKRAYNAIGSILHGKLPKVKQDLIQIRGTITIPLFKFLVRLIFHKDYQVRKYTAFLLANVQENDDKILPILVKMLQDSKADVCKMSAQALVKIGLKCLPYLQKALDSAPLRAQISMAWILGNWPTDSRKLLSQLFSLLQNPEPRLFHPIVWTIKNMGKVVVPEIIDKMKSSNDPVVNQHLLTILGEIRPELSSDILDILQKSLEHADTKVKCSAIITMAKLGIDAKQIWLENIFSEEEELGLSCLEAIREYPHSIPEILPKIAEISSKDTLALRKLAIQIWAKEKIANKLMEFLDDLDKECRKIAIQGLAFSGGHLDIFIPKLLYIAKNDSHEDVQITCIQAMGRLGIYAGAHVIEWLGEVACQSGFRQIPALQALVEFKKATLPIVPKLLKLLSCKDDTIVAKVFDVFVSIGRPCIHDLIELAVQSSIDVRSIITKILIAIGPDIVDDMVQMLLGCSANHRRVAVDVLGSLGEHSISHLITLMDSDDFWVRKAVARSLEKNGKIVVSYLLRILQEPHNPDVLAMAVEVLKKLKQKALPLLLPFISDGNPRLSQLAMGSLRFVSPDYQSCLPEILPLLKSENSLVRRAVVWCMEKMECTTPDNLAILEKIQAEDPDAQVRDVAKQSLQTLRHIKEHGPTVHTKMQD